MAGEAHLRARLTLDSNVDEAVKRASEGLTKAASDVEKSQKKMAETIVRGDPLKAIEVQVRKEIAAIERMAATDVKLRADAERAKEAIIQRHGLRMTAILERQAKEQAAAGNAARDSIVSMKGPLNDVRSLMERFAGESTGALGDFAKFGKDALSAFGSGGALAIGIAATTGLVFNLATAWKEAKDEAIKARVAASGSWIKENKGIEDLTAAIQTEVDRRRAALEGATPEQLRADSAVGDARLVVSERAGTVRGLESERDSTAAAIEEEKARIAELAASGIRAGAGRLNELEADAERVAALLADANHALGRAKANLDNVELAAGRLTGVATDEKTKKEAEDAAKLAKAEAKRRAEEDARRQESMAEALLRVEQQQADIDEKTEAKTLAAARKNIAAFQKGEDEKNEKLHAISQEALGWAANDLLVDEKANEQLGIAGASWAVSFASGFANALKEGDAGGIMSSVLMGAAAAVAAFVPGVGGIVGAGGLALLGGLFERGGTPFAHHIPQGRNGLAVMPGLNYDAKPAWLHKNEVVMPEAVVNDEFGGLPEAARVAAGKGGPRFSGGSSLTVNLKALDAVDAIGGMRRSFGKAFPAQRTNRQSARMFEAMAPKEARSR